MRLLNANGEVLYQNTEALFTEDIPEKNTYINENLLLYRDSTSFSCQVLIPKSYIDNEVRQLQWYLFIPMGILLLFGVGFSFFWSYRYALPLQKTVDSLHIGDVSSVQTEKGLNAIYYSVQELVKNEAQIQQALNEEKILRKDEFFSALLFSGVVVSDQFVQERARSLNISADYAYYTVVYDHCELLPDDQDIQDDGSILIKSAILNRTLYTLIPQMAGFYRPQMSQNGILIIGLDQPNRQEIEELMEQVFMLLWKEYHIRLYCTIGVPCKRLGMISGSYLAAKYKMEHSPMGRRSCCLPRKTNL